MKVYLVRHGQTYTNALACHSGWADIPLTAQGERDALEAGELLKGIRFDRVYTSDLRRAVQTEKIALRGADTEYSPLLRELNVGCLAGHFVSDCEAKYGEEYIENKKKYDYSPYGGETYEMLAARVSRFLKQLEDTGAETVAVFCHAGVIRTMADVIFGVFVPRKALACDNGSVSVIEYQNGSWRVLEWNRKNRKTDACVRADAL